MSYLEAKYLNMLGPHLRNFKRKSGNLWEFSCPFCGDSQKNPRKARGYVFSTPQGLFYKCHNCSLSTNVPKLIKHVSPAIYEEYNKEKLLEKYGPKTPLHERMQAEGPPIVVSRAVIGDLDSVDWLHRYNRHHPCVEFVVNRQIPKEWWPRLYYVPKFFEWTNSLIPEKFSEKALANDSGRLIIPFIGKDKKIFGYQGRLLDGVGEKYYTIILNSGYPKIFGLDRADTKRKFYVLEGPIDSMFISNSIAVAGGDLHSVSSRDNAVLVFDNEPRHKDTCKKIQRAINLGFKVCIWPERIIEKDINEMVLTGMPVEYIKSVIDDSTYKDLEAQLQFNAWKKI